MKKKNFKKNPRQIVQGFTAVAMLFIAAQGQAQVVTPPTTITQTSRVKDLFVDNLNVREAGNTTDATATYRRFLTPSLGGGGGVFFTLNLGGGSEMSQFYQAATNTTPLTNALRFSKEATAGARFIWDKVATDVAKTRTLLMVLNASTNDLEVMNNIQSRGLNLVGGPLTGVGTLNPGSITASGDILGNIITARGGFVTTGAITSGAQIKGNSILAESPTGVRGNITGAAITGTTITGTNFVGNGSGLTGINATLAPNAVINTTGSITTSVALKANSILAESTAGVKGPITGGIITGTNFVGNGSGLTGINATLAANAVINTTGAITTTANITGKDIYADNLFIKDPGSTTHILKNMRFLSSSTQNLPAAQGGASFTAFKFLMATSGGATIEFQNDALTFYRRGETNSKFIWKNQLKDLMTLDSNDNKLNVAGEVTATAFVGDGSKLTNLPTTPWTRSGDRLLHNDARIDVSKNAIFRSGIEMPYFGTIPGSWSLSPGGFTGRDLRFSASGDIGSFTFTENGNFNLLGNITANGSMNVGIDALIKKNLTVEGNLIVRGTTTQQNIIQQNGNFTVTGWQVVNQNSSVLGNFFVTGESNLQGNVGIGTSVLHPNATLTVDGHVHISEKGGTNNSTWLATHTPNYLLWVEKGIVTTDFALAEPIGWKDEVFKADYKLPTLSEVEKHIKDKGYLHTMPSENEITTNGYSLHDMNKRMVQTIEELTLHSIAQEKEINSQNDLINNLMKRLELLEKKTN